MQPRASLLLKKAVESGLLAMQHSHYGIPYTFLSALLGWSIQGKLTKLLTTIRIWNEDTRGVFVDQDRDGTNQEA